jgi:pimeloyl-ACP methyl ester carboxylesterase
LAYTAAHRERVRSLTLVDADPPDLQALTAGLRRLEARISALMRAGKIPDPLPPVVGDDCSAPATAIVPVFFADPDFMPPRSLITECRQGVADATNAAMTNRVFARVRAGLARYRGPALILMGREDPLGVDSGVIPQIRALVSARVRVELFPGAGHMPWFESPRFMPIVRRFVMSHIST